MNTDCCTEVKLRHDLIVVDRIALGIDRYFGSQAEGDIVLHALRAYGHVLRAKLVSASPQRFTFGQFADEISSVYDVTCRQTALIVGTLRTLEARQRDMLQVATLTHL